MIVRVPATALPGLRRRGRSRALRIDRPGARDLSLDVVAGAVAGGVMAARVAGVHAPWTWWPILAAAVWATYTADHLADAHRPGARCLSSRHRFHRDHGPALGVVWMVVVAGSLSLSIATLPLVVVASGTTLVGAVVAHLVLAQSRSRIFVPKEVRAAVIYTVGIWLAPVILSDGDRWRLAALMALHASAAFANLAMIAWFERGQDRTEGSPSLALSLGRRRLRAIVRGAALLGASGGVLGVLLGGGRPPAVTAAFAVLAALHVVPWALIRGARFTRRGEWYRVVGDLAFLACLLVLPWPAP